MIQKKGKKKKEKKKGTEHAQGRDNIRKDFSCKLAWSSERKQEGLGIYLYKKVASD